MWKRFNDIKALLKFIKKRHKTEHLNGIVPTLSNHTFFKRFEADVITERKLFIIRLLDFVGQHPALYKSQVFQAFFNTSQTMPKEEMLLFETDDIAADTTTAATMETDTVDGGASNGGIADVETPIASTSSSMNESFESSSMSTPIIDSPAELSDGYKASSENDFIINDSIKISPTDRSAAVLTRQYSRYAFGLGLQHIRSFFGALSPFINNITIALIAQLWSIYSSSVISHNQMKIDFMCIYLQQRLCIP